MGGASAVNAHNPLENVSINGASWPTLLVRHDQVHVYIYNTSQQGRIQKSSRNKKLLSLIKNISNIRKKKSLFLHIPLCFHLLFSIDIGVGGGGLLHTKFRAVDAPPHPPPLYTPRPLKEAQSVIFMNIAAV